MPPSCTLQSQKASQTAIYHPSMRPLAVERPHYSRATYVVPPSAMAQRPSCSCLRSTEKIPVGVVTPLTSATFSSVVTSYTRTTFPVQSLT